MNDVPRVGERPDLATCQRACDDDAGHARAPCCFDARWRILKHDAIFLLRSQQLRCQQNISGSGVPRFTSALHTIA